MLILKHFDTTTGNWIEIPNPEHRKPGQPKTLILTESIKPSILEVLARQAFPDEDPTDWFSVGKVDELSTPDELRNHPNGDIPLVSSKGRAIFGPAKMLPLIQQANGNDLNRSAYGSVQIGGCEKNVTALINYLVVDRHTGENGGYLPNECAREWVSDGGGAIASQVAQEQFNTQEHLIQFRLLVIDDCHYAKGTVAAEKIADRLIQKPENGQPITLVLPIDAFKGAAKGNIQPGLYTRSVWFGEKERSRKGEMALSQPLADNVEGLRDRLPQVEQTLLELKDIVQDPRQLMQVFVEQYEKRAKKQNEKWIAPNVGSEEIIDRYRFFLEQSNSPLEIDEEESKSQYEDFIYLAIKAHPNLESHPFIGIPKFKTTLTDFVKDRFLETAIGKIHKGDRGMAKASQQLQYGEICVSWMPDGETILALRSPYLNHNGLRMMVNRYIDAMIAPSGNPRQGAILINDDSWGEIVTRLHAQAQQASATLQKQDLTLPPLADPPSALDNLNISQRIAFTEQFNQILQQLNASGAKIPLLPYESDIEAMALDFDGDCLAVIEAHQLPNYAAEQSRKLQSEIYLPTPKRAKVSVPEGTSYEEVIIHTSDGISVGVINNAVQTFTSLQAELDLFERYGGELKLQYAVVLQEMARNLITQTNNPKSRLNVPEALLPDYQAIATSSLSSGDALTTLFDQQRQIYRWMVQQGCIHNQDAVDLFKSWYKPNLQAVNSLTPLLFRNIEIIRDKKAHDVYTQRTLNVNGYAPHEITSRLVNDTFQAYPLDLNPFHSFKQFCPDDYTPRQLLAIKEIKEQYDTLFNYATQQSQKSKIEDAHLFKLATTDEKNLEITNYKYFLNHNEARQIANTSIDHQVSITLVENDHYRTRKTHHLKAMAALPNGEVKAIGTVCELSRQALNLEAGQKLFVQTITLARPLSEKEQQLLFFQARQLTRQWRQSLDAQTPPHVVQQYFNAAWHLSTKEDKNNLYKVNNFVFDAFGDYILNNLRNSQFPYISYNATGLDKGANLTPDPFWQTDQPVQFKIKFDLEDEKKYWYIQNPETGDEYRFATVSDRTYQLPIGTTVQGAIQGDLSTTAYLTIDHPNAPQDREIIFGNLDKFSMAQHHFNNERHTVVLKTGLTLPQPYFYLNDTKIGKLSNESVELFQQTGQYREQTLTVHLSLSEKGNYKKLLATTAAQELPPFEILPLYPDQPLEDYAEQTVSLRLAIEQPKKALMGVHLQQSDGTLRPIGQFTNNWKVSRDALTQAGLFREGTTFNATINSRLSAVTIKIDPDTLKFPPMGQWQRPHAITQPLSQSVDPITQHFLNALTHQPTIQYHFHQQWHLANGDQITLPTLGIAIDARLAETFDQTLEQLNVPHSIRNPGELTAYYESQKGLIGFWFVPCDLSPKARNFLENLSHYHYEADLTNLSESPYHQFLQQLVPPSEKAHEAIKSCYRELKPLYDSINKVPVRRLPTLLSVEDYAKQQADGRSQTQPTWKLTFDQTKLKSVIEKLEERKIPYEIATSQDLADEETRLGYLAIRIPLNVLNYPEHRPFTQALIYKFGEPLDANYNGNYWTRLGEIEAGADSQIATLPKSDLPSLKLPFIVKHTINSPLAKEPAFNTEIPIKAKIQMTFSLEWEKFGQLSPYTNVTSTLEAMRQLGRDHTTRNFEPYRHWNVQNGDLAIAYNNQGQQVLFQVGKQYRITPEQVNNPEYRQNWENREKHSVNYLDQLAKQNPNNL